MHQPHHLFDHALKALKPKGKAVIMTPSWEHNMWGPFILIILMLLLLLKHH